MTKLTLNEDRDEEESLRILKLETTSNILVKDKDWSYNISCESSHWVEDYPEARGEQQSPINISSPEAVYSPKTKRLQINYGMKKEVELINTGSTVSIRPRVKQLLKTETIAAVTGGPLNESEYELVEVVFHWGKQSTRGSEHTINLKSYPMEIQMIHINTKYSSPNEAYAQPDGVLVTSTLVMEGQHNLAFKSIIDSLPCTTFKGEKIILSSAIYLEALLPDEDVRSDYWYYKGSLTHPPCTECVTWILFRYPITLSHQQLEEFRRLRNHACDTAPLYNDDDGFLVDNFRPTQALNSRTVYSSFQTL